jgi:hypothetical protein
MKVSTRYWRRYNHFYLRIQVFAIWRLVAEWGVSGVSNEPGSLVFKGNEAPEKINFYLCFKEYSAFRLICCKYQILSNPGGGEIFRTCPDRPWGPPSLLYNGYRVFPGGIKRLGRDADPSPPSSAKV